MTPTIKRPRSGPPDIIATRTYDVRQAKGKPTKVTVQFMRPRRAGGDWTCDVVIKGLSRVPDGSPFSIYGVDAVQALWLAFYYAEVNLSTSPEFKEGRLTFLGERETALPSALKAPVSPRLRRC